MTKGNAQPARIGPPAGLSAEQSGLLNELIARNDARHGDDLLGVVLSGSVGRGLGTERSDLDVYVVLADTAGRGTARSPLVDEIPIGIQELEAVPPFGSDGWWQRWSFAWAPILLDRTGGRLEQAIHRQATLTREEQAAILADHDRLDGWLNFAYRSLKSERDGRHREARLDAAESLPWLLDVIFALGGRVRPYNKYLAWELREHPLDGLPAETTVALLDSTLAGDPDALRAAFERVESACSAFDREQGGTALTDVIAAWGDELSLFHR